MKINFNQPLMKFGKDEPLLKSNSDQATAMAPDVASAVIVAEPFCLKDAAIEALLASETNQTGEEKVKRYLMATKIYANPDEVDFTVEEIAKIKQAIGKGYGALVVGQAWDILEGK